MWTAICGITSFSQLDPETQMAWELKNLGKKILLFEDFLAFVILRALKGTDTNTQPAKSVKTVNVANKTHTRK